MKITIQIVVLTLCFHQGYSQMAVSDAPLLGFLKGTKVTENKVNQTRFVKEYQEMVTQSKFLKEQYDNLQIINSAIKSSHQVKRIAHKQKVLIESIVDGINTVAKSNVSPDTKDVVIERLLEDKQMSMGLFEMVNDILTPGLLKMNDAERLNYMDNLESKIDKLLNKVREYNYRIQRIINTYQLYDR